MNLYINVRCAAAQGLKTVVIGDKKATMVVSGEVHYDVVFLYCVSEHEKMWLTESRLDISPPHPLYTPEWPGPST